MRINVLPIQIDGGTTIQVRELQLFKNMFGGWFYFTFEFYNDNQYLGIYMAKFNRARFDALDEFTFSIIVNEKNEIVLKVFEKNISIGNHNLPELISPIDIQVIYT